MTGRVLVAGVDSSTQSTKLELRERDSGRLVCRASAPHSHVRWDPPVSEQDPEVWWEALARCFAQCREADRADVVAVSVAGQQHGLVLVAEDGTVLRPAKLWNDTTSAPQARDLVARLGAGEWARRCGSVPLAAFTIAKLAWVLEHEPEMGERTARVMLPHDWLSWRLTGAHVTDRGDASGTGWFDPVRGAVDPGLLATAVGDAAPWMDRLPQVLAPTTAAGEITAKAAADLGLPEGVLVGPGTGDNMAAALGLGLRPGDAVISLGTSGTAYCVSSTPVSDPTGAVAGFADATGAYLPLVCTLNATRVTDTVARWLGVDPAELAALALAAEPNPAPPVLVPYFDGERTPNLPDATGTFTGLRADTSRADLALAAHDGVLCGLLDGLDAITQAGAEKTSAAPSGTDRASAHKAAAGTGARCYLVGGGARSLAYQVRAAALSGREVTVPTDDETVATGAALQAAVVATGSTVSNPFTDIARDWNLGQGQIIPPHPNVDPAMIREHYQSQTTLLH